MLENIVTLKAIEFERVNQGGILRFRPQETMDGFVREVNVAFSQLKDALFCLQAMMERCSVVPHCYDTIDVVTKIENLRHRMPEKGDRLVFEVHHDVITLINEASQSGISLTSLEELSELIEKHVARAYH